MSDKSLSLSELQLLALSAVIEERGLIFINLSVGLAWSDWRDAMLRRPTVVALG